MAALLGLVAGALAIGSIVTWIRLIRAVEIGERRSAVSVVLVVALALGLLSLFGDPGFVGGSFAVLGVVVGGLYFGLLSLARQSQDAPAVAVGSPLPDFTAPDHEGRPFALASLKGHPVLMKFFRGHW